MQRISQTIKILKFFRTVFDEYKENLAPFFGDRPIANWSKISKDIKDIYRALN